MGGRKSKHAEQSPSLGFALRMLLSVNVFHEKPEYPICCTSAAWCQQDLDTSCSSSPFRGKGKLRRAVSLAAEAGRSLRLSRCRALPPQARCSERWVNLTVPAGVMSGNRGCRKQAKSCGKDVGLLWDLKGRGRKTRLPRVPRTGVRGFRCFFENSGSVRNCPNLSVVFPFGIWLFS